MPPGAESTGGFSQAFYKRRAQQQQAMQDRNAAAARAASGAAGAAAGGGLGGGFGSAMGAAFGGAAASAVPYSGLGSFTDPTGRPGVTFQRDTPVAPPPTDYTVGMPKAPAWNIFPPAPQAPPRPDYTVGMPQAPGPNIFPPAPQAPQPSGGWGGTSSMWGQQPGQGLGFWSDLPRGDQSDAIRDRSYEQPAPYQGLGSNWMLDVPSLPLPVAGQRSQVGAGEFDPSLGAYMRRKIEVPGASGIFGQPEEGYIPVPTRKAARQDLGHFLGLEKKGRTGEAETLAKYLKKEKKSGISHLKLSPEEIRELKDRRRIDKILAESRERSDQESAEVSGIPLVEPKSKWEETPDYEKTYEQRRAEADVLVAERAQKRRKEEERVKREKLVSGDEGDDEPEADKPSKAKGVFRKGEEERLWRFIQAVPHLQRAGKKAGDKWGAFGWVRGNLAKLQKLVLGGQVQKARDLHAKIQGKILHLDRMNLDVKGKAPAPAGGGGGGGGGGVFNKRDAEQAQRNWEEAMRLLEAARDAIGNSPTFKSAEALLMAIMSGTGVPFNDAMKAKIFGDISDRLTRSMQEEIRGGEAAIAAAGLRTGPEASFRGAAAQRAAQAGAAATAQEAARMAEANAAAQRQASSQAGQLAVQKAAQENAIRQQMAQMFATRKYPAYV